ncbi:MAG: LemA family protein [Bacteroidota bacterium]
MKKPSLVVFGIIATVLLILLMSGCNAYQKLVSADQQVQSSWSEVQNQYQRRADLIPNLVNTVKGYAKQEQQVLTQVVEARSRATQLTLSKDILDDSVALKRFESAQGELSGVLSRLLSVTEAYPQLQSNQNFLALQTDLAGTENRITVARGRFNEQVRLYNTEIRSFPDNIFAGMLGFHPRAYFQATPGSDRAPTVTF